MSFESMYHSESHKSIQQQDLSSILRLEATSHGIVDFLGRYAGESFCQGLYRIHPITEMSRWTTTVVEAFPEFGGRVFCFSYDWLGRHFAVDFGRLEGGQCQILMLEPGTGQALEIPANFRDFHDIELVQYQDEALAGDSYRAWLAAGGAVPSAAQCIGYRKPLFLGGQDVASNFEVTDLEVYWSICGQLLAKIRGLPNGTKIGNIRIV